MKILSTLAVCAASASVSAAASPKILLVGDSWAEKAGTPLAKVLEKHQSPLEVVNKGIGGSTAKQWAENKNSVKTLVDLHGGKDVEFVWVSVGGNDAQDELPGCQIAGGSKDECVQKCIDNLMVETKKFLDPVVEAYPDIKIFQFGYDILNFGQNLECIAMGTALFPSCHDNAECINTEFVKIQHDYVEVLSQNYTQHTALNILGTLQHAGHDQAASVGNPDLKNWSPKNLMEDNCIHASQTGFGIIFEQIYSMYLEGNTTSK